jgi:hypothetical protein
MLAQPLGGWRRVAVREFKTKKDWTHEVRILLEEDFPKAKKVMLVCDNFSVAFLGHIRPVRFTIHFNRDLPDH